MNNNLGLIGLGNMGYMILNQFLKLNLITQEDVYVSNRSIEKINKTKEIYPNINAYKDNTEVAKKCNKIILCVEPINVPSVLLEINPFLNSNTYLMISTSTVAYEDLYKIYKGKITKFMPTLNSTVGNGITLVCHNGLVTEEERIYFEGLMSKISEVKKIKEEDMNLCHNLTGSFPAIISEIMVEFINAASEYSVNITKEEIEHMVMVSLEGATKLFSEKTMKFEDTINKVSTKGGITYEGIKIYQQKLPEIFKEAFETTIKKYDEITKDAANIVNELTKKNGA